MIKIELDIPMPKACWGCLLLDDEFAYCHGHLTEAVWELDEYIKKPPYTKPEWCPLIEVKDETKRNN